MKKIISIIILLTVTLLTLSCSLKVTNVDELANKIATKNVEKKFEFCLDTCVKSAMTQLIKQFGTPPPENLKSLIEAKLKEQCTFQCSVK